MTANDFDAAAQRLAKGVCGRRWSAGLASVRATPEGVSRCGAGGRSGEPGHRRRTYLHAHRQRLCR